MRNVARVQTHARNPVLNENVHPKIVSERLGRSLGAFTLDAYSSVLPDLQAVATERLDVLVIGEPVATEEIA